MSFDPDKYIAAKTKTREFDPDKYILSKSSEIPSPRSDMPKWGTENPRLYGVARAARDIVGPTAEMLGSIGGGIAGGAAGTVASPSVVINPVTGAVAGSALGYGIVKSALDVADELLGLKAPAQTISDAAMRGVENTATGAAYELAGRGIGKVLQKGAELTGIDKVLQKGAELTGKGVSRTAGAIMDMADLPKQKAAKLARDAAGDKLPIIQQALRQAPQDVTAAQAIAYQIDPLTGKAVIYAPETQALLRAIEETKPSIFGDIARKQDAVTRNMLAEIARSPTQAGSITERIAQKEALNKLTTPIREAELSAANTAGAKLTELEAKSAQKQASMIRALQDQSQLATESAQRTAVAAKGEPGFLTQGDRAAEYADAANVMRLVKGQRQLEKEFIDYQIQSLAAHGLKPLESGPIITEIRSVLFDPKYAANDVVMASVENVALELAKWTSKGGIIDANALYAIRKNAVNAAIAKIRPGLDQTAQKEAASKVLSKIKPIIDNAIVAAGGTEWRTYLDLHEAGMRELSKTKLGAEAMKLYSSSPQKFLDLVENNSPKTIQKIFGADTYDIVKAMGEETASRLQAAGQQIRRVKDINAQASEGQKELDLLLKDHFVRHQLPNMLNVTTTAINKILRILTNKLGKKTMDVLTRSALDAKSFDELLNTLPASERNSILKTLKDPKLFAESIKPTEAVRGGLAAGVGSYVNNQDNKLSTVSGKNKLME